MLESKREILLLDPTAPEMLSYVISRYMIKDLVRYIKKKRGLLGGA